MRPQPTESSDTCSEAITDIPEVDSWWRLKTAHRLAFIRPGIGNRVIADPRPRCGAQNTGDRARSYPFPNGRERPRSGEPWCRRWRSVCMIRVIRPISAGCGKTGTGMRNAALTCTPVPTTPFAGADGSNTRDAPDRRPRLRRRGRSACRGARSRDCPNAFDHGVRCRALRQGGPLPSPLLPRIWPLGDSLARDARAVDSPRRVKTISGVNQSAHPVSNAKYFPDRSGPSPSFVGLVRPFCRQVTIRGLERWPADISCASGRDARRPPIDE